MTPEEIIARALSAVGRPTKYVLGKGGRKPDASHPADKGGTCDCSGYVAWCLGLDRYQPGDEVLAKYNGGWLSTSALVYLAKRGGPIVARGLVARPGDLLVYGDYVREGARRQGHVGVVVEVPEGLHPSQDEWWRRAKVAHCSSSASKRGDAIAVTDAMPWRARGIVARPLPPSSVEGPVTDPNGHGDAG